MNDQRWQRAAHITLTVFGVGVAAYLFFRFLLWLFLPFLLAFLLSLLTRTLALRLSWRTGLSHRVAACLVTVGAMLLLSLLLFVLCNRLTVEIQNLFAFLSRDSEDPNGEIARLIASFRAFWQRLPFLSDLQQNSLVQELIGDPQEYLAQHFRDALANATATLAGGVGTLLKKLPGVLLFVLLFVISSFYFAMDYEGVVRTIKGMLPQRIAQRLPYWHRVAGETGKRCAKAYLLLFLLTAGELFLGFLLLGVRYPFLLALLIAALDILPVLGVGVALIPLALFYFIGGSVARGIGVLVLYLLMTVVRQIAEPHLVGKSIGLHPLAMLISFYVGLKLFGIAGLLLGPGIALFCKTLFEKRGQGEG